MNVFLCFASIILRYDTGFGKQCSQQVRLTVWIYPTPIKVSVFMTPLGIIIHESFFLSVFYPVCSAARKLTWSGYKE